MALPNDHREGDLPPDLALKGGLHGRLAGSFCILQSSVEALQRYLEVNTNPSVREETKELFAEILQTVAGLERLSFNAADLALGCAGGPEPALGPMELAGHLRVLCECAQEETALRGCAVGVAFQGQPGPWWVMGAPALVEGIFANLFSNALRGGARQITLAGTPEGALLWQENGAGLSPAAAALLAGGAVPAEYLAAGCLGLLLVRQYAGALGWRLSCAAGGGLYIWPVPAQLPAPDAVLCSAAAQDRRRRAECRTRLCRELDGADLRR